MRLSERKLILNPLKYSLLFIIFLNIYILYKFKISEFNQILNLMISCGVYSFYCENNYKNKENLSIFKISYSFLLLSMILYRSLWLHVGDNFIYILFPGLYLSLLMLYSSINNVIKNYKPFLISLILPICKGLFIPLSIIFSPLSSFFTWLLLNTVGFSSVLKGQEIFYNNRGINVTFSCSGSGQILFSLSAMIILNLCFPLRNKRLFLLTLLISFLITFSLNIIRLFLLTLFVHTVNSDGFSMFEYLHSGSGGLIFGFLSMAFSCEAFKRLYFADDISNEINK